ncbi:glycoside hydrolase family 31 protein [Anaerocolumna sp. MB42-C2]|uniref:glycoside hydrolase family 31 protein n=1 Tax=Anaerocolumna sp. MB42-C2 TaxID=3070997 RepID=UPI0027E0EBA6|nr:TIM-barrel domain-containing protein [Anaerocolumna sp. MB42-C2]WMJ87194.1 glycoside hydrolase family 31 protein [Anaerocolumna sp. MB42-C2]
MEFIHRENNSLEYQFNGETLRIEPWGADSFRVRSTVLGQLIDTDYALLPQPEHVPHIQTEEYRGEIVNGKIKAVLEVSGWNKKCTISFYNQKGELLLKEAGDGGALNKKNRTFKPNLGGDYSLTVTFASASEEKLYGMGQYQQDILNIKNCNLELAHRNSQASVPFVLSSLGYGFLWHNPAVGRVSFGKNNTEWYAESTKQMDYWITAGDTPDEIERAYADVTGKVPMMPEYGMGFWQCKLRYWNQEQLLNVAREYKKRNIPINLIVCDFFHWPKMGDFRFDDEFFPDPEVMVKELKEMGIELMVSVWPQIDLKSENFAEMQQKGLLVKTERGVEICMCFGGESVFFDATNPKARNYVWDKCRKNYYSKGIKVFWLDEAEPEYTVYDFDNYRYFLGTNIQVGNIYPQLYSRTFYDGLRESGQDNIINLVRCAWAGSQRYGALVWSGDIHCDYETFRKQLCAGLNMGIAGIPWWTTDIGGFSGGFTENEDFQKLLIRWFEWGTFCPVMRLHGDRGPGEKVYRKDGSEAISSGSDNEVWSFGEENYNIMVKYIRFREAMRPYTRELMEEAHSMGKPVMRTMFYEFPKEEICWELKDEYMYGSDILVAPVMYEDMFERNVYLPKGAIWTNVHDGKDYEGGQTVTVTAELDVIPVFLRDGRLNELIGLI